jgi:DNA-binding CsgD family transcriptional regulator
MKRASDQQGLHESKTPLVPPHAAASPTFIAMVRRLSIAHSFAEVMETVTHAARKLLAADGITFVVREGDLCHYADEDAISPLWRGRRFPMKACISGWCMLERRAVVIPDIYQDHRIPQEAYRPTFVRSLAMVPVRQDDPIAAIGAYWARTRQVGVAEVELLQCIANAAALATKYIDLERRRQFDVPGCESMERKSDLVKVGGGCPAWRSDSLAGPCPLMRGPRASADGALPFAGLSKRQVEILVLLADGKTNAQIASALSRSPHTIKLHVSAIMRHLNVTSRTQAALLASKLAKGVSRRNDA